MRSLFTFLLLLSSMPQVKAAANKVSIRVLQSSGSILDRSQSLKPVPWTGRSRVSDRLALSLGTGAQTKIQLHPKITLTAYGDTEFEIPVISWETRHFKEIKLIKGSLRLSVDGQPFDFEVTTPFFQVSPPPGLWVFSVDLERALADVLALKGTLEVTSLNSEDKVILKSGQKATFRGLLEEGEIAYDLLLKGRKIPKGKWLEVEKLNSSDNQKFSIESEIKRIQREREQKAQTLRDTLKKQAGDICTKPYGDLGECLWRKQKNQCIRTRCAADGKWKDPQVVGLSFCDKAGGWTPAPKKCDY